MRFKICQVIVMLASLTYLTSCEKEDNLNKENPYYRLKVDGKLKQVDACGSSAHVAEFLRDTAVFAGFGCGGVRAGLYLKGRIVDGIYPLDNKNVAWLDDGGINYITDETHKGSLELKNIDFQGVGAVIPFVKGTFYFDAVDKSSGKTVKVTAGSYLLRKYSY